jgi:DNA-directed RNA polymerase subunit omega
LLGKVENKYILALLSAKRARELFEGKETLINVDYINKVTTAIHEIENGKVTYERKPDRLADDFREGLLEGSQSGEDTDVAIEADDDESLELVEES